MRQKNLEESINLYLDKGEAYVIHILMLRIPSAADNGDGISLTTV